MSEYLRQSWSRSKAFRIILVIAVIYTVLRLAVQGVYLATLLVPENLPEWVGAEEPMIPADLQIYLNAAKHLQPGGLLLIDLFNPDVKRLTEVAGVQELADIWTDPVTGARVVKWSVRTVYWAEQIQETTFIYEELWPDGRSAKTLCSFPLRFLWRSELELLLPAAGLQIEALWGDFEGSPYDDGSERLVVLARRA